MIRLGHTILAGAESARWRSYKFDGALVWGGCLTLLGLSVLCFAATLRVTGPVLTWDGEDYAQIARQLGRGKGQTTKLLLSELMDETERYGPLSGPWANVLRPPLPVFAMTASFKFVGYTDLAAVLWAGGFYVLSAPALYLAAFPLFGYRAAFLAGLVFLLSRCGVAYARAGLSESAAMFFLIAVFWIIARERDGMHWPALAGIGMGACWLARPIAILWLVAAAPLVARDPQQPARMRGAIRIAALLAGFLLVVLFSKYTFHWSGTRVAMAINVAYRVGPVEEAMASMPRFVLHHLSGMAMKYAHEISRPLIYLFEIGGMGFFSALIPFSLLARGDARQIRGKAFLVMLFLLNALFLAFLTSGDAFAGPLRYFDVIAPLGLPWAALFLLNFNDSLSAWRRLSFYGLLLVYLGGSAVQSIRDPFAKPVDRPMYEAITRLVGETEVIAVSLTAGPTAVAWYADRRTLTGPGDFDRLVAGAVSKGVPVKWFLGADRESPPPHFAADRKFSGGLVLYRREKTL